jgi:hypothetical protein
LEEFRSRPLQPVHSKLFAAAGWLEEHPAWLGALTILLGVGLVTSRVLERPLWHDELFTYYVTQADSFHRMILQTQTVDLNPPLYYIAVRFVYHFLNPSNLAVRLPAAIAFLLSGYLLFLFVGRRLGPLYGVLASLVLLSSTYQIYASEARPYAFVLFFLSLALVGWQRAVEESGLRRAGALGLLFLGGVGMLLSHVLALIAYAGFFLAELIRLWVRRRPDWAVWVALLLPLFSVVVYRPLLRSHSAAVYPTMLQASFHALVVDYRVIENGIAPLLAIAAIAIVLVGAHIPERSIHGQRSFFSKPEAVLAAYLALVPFFTTVLFMRSHSAYFSRYGIVCVVGLAIFVPWFFAYWTRMNRLAALTCCVVFAYGLYPPSFFLELGRRLAGHSATSDFAMSGLMSQSLSQVRPDLPFVDASGLTFLEMDHRADDSFARRIYYLTDQQAAMQYAHATLFEGLSFLKHEFPIRANVVPYEQFIQQHRTFLVYGTVDYPEDWLLRKLMADGATVQYLGKFRDSYKDEDLYQVALGQP